MSSQFGQQPHKQAGKGMGMFELNVELLGQLTVHGLDNLADSVEGTLECWRELLSLVATPQGQKFRPIMVQQLLGHLANFRPKRVPIDVARLGTISPDK